MWRHDIAGALICDMRLRHMGRERHNPQLAIILRRVPTHHDARAANDATPHTPHGMHPADMQYSTNMGAAPRDKVFDLLVGGAS